MKRAPTQIVNSAGTIHPGLARERLAAEFPDMGAHLNVFVAGKESLQDIKAGLGIVVERPELEEQLEQGGVDRAQEVAISFLEVGKDPPFILALVAGASIGRQVERCKGLPVTDLGRVLARHSQQFISLTISFKKNRKGR